MTKTQTERIEILAPAGHPDALRAAVYAGADAVYLAGPSFGARAAAVNFTEDELRDAAVFCRARGVRVYVTVNILLKDGELRQALRFVRFLCDIPVDGIIVQDVGLLALIRAAAPEMPVHASTQMSVHSRAGAALLEEYGVSRVVLARELRIEEIAEIHAHTAIGLEAFVHGALCMSVSGQCYFSAALGGRSGNRGQCAQTCRLPFAGGGRDHALSLRDLSGVQLMPQMLAAGVRSFKIEGRMKRPEYVAAAVTACRMAACGEPVTPELLDSLEAVFSRAGFTAGYLTGETGGDMFGVRRPEDAARGREALPKLRHLYRGERQAVAVHVTLEDTLPVALSVRDEDGRVVRCQDGQAPPEAHLQRARCEAQLRKTGGTPFAVDGVDVPSDGARVTIASLNALRRQALAELLALRADARPVPFSDDAAAGVLAACQADGRRAGAQKRAVKLRAAYRSLEQVTTAAQAFEAVYLPLETDLAGVAEKGLPPAHVILALPRASFGLQREDRLLARMRDCMAHGYRAFACGNLGAVQLCREIGAEPHGTFGLNVMNGAALQAMRELGLQSTELSMELSTAELRGFSSVLPRGVMVYGRQALMLTRNCPVRGADGCVRCRGENALRDRKGVLFPVVCDGAGKAGCAQVLNSVPLSMAGRLAELAGMDFGILRFTVENAVECDAVTQGFLQGEKPQYDHTRGLFARGVL